MTFSVKYLYKFYNKHFSREREFTERVASVVGHTPVYITLYKTAFLHKSSPTEVNGIRQHNERLEFLGDSVLNSIVAEFLYKKYPNGDEGFLTKMRSKIVKRQTLNQIAHQMELNDLVSYLNNTPISRSMLGNALEALLGAIYLENGYGYTRNYVIQNILKKYIDIRELEDFDDNFKSRLLEWCQKNGREVGYELIAKYKAEKRDKFKVAVIIDGDTIALADDYNKKNAEQMASERAMKQLGIIHQEELVNV